MKTSEKAVEKLKDELVNRLAGVGLGYRVYQDLDGSGRFKLALKLDRKRPDDETIESHGVCIFLDPLSSIKLKDLELDYTEGPNGCFILKDQQIN